MSPDTDIAAPPPRYSALGAWLILAVMVGVELYIQFGAGDPANWSQFRFRMMTEYGFMDRKFDAWLAGGSSQGLLRMFVTYLFVHGGPLHLAVNGALFVFVAPFLCRHIGAVRLLILFVVCGFTGGIAFGLTNDISGPLVGGSAAIMGMLWAVKFWEFRWIRRRLGPLHSVDRVPDRSQCDDALAVAGRRGDRGAYRRRIGRDPRGIVPVARTASRTLHPVTPP